MNIRSFTSSGFSDQREVVKFVVIHKGEFRKGEAESVVRVDIERGILVLFNILQDTMDESAFVEVDEMANVIWVAVFNEGEISEIDTQIRDFGW